MFLVDSTPDNILDDMLCACNQSFSVIFRVIISTRGNKSHLHYFRKSTKIWYLFNATEV
jgi:hypothetical protein